MKNPVAKGRNSTTILDNIFSCVRLDRVLALELAPDGGTVMLEIYPYQNVSRARKAEGPINLRTCKALE